MKPGIRHVLYAMAMAAFVHSTATAAVIPANQVTATASSENAVSGFPPHEPASHTVDGSGLTLDPNGPPNSYTHTDSSATIWQTAALSDNGSPATIGTTLTLTFAQNYNIDAFHIWQISGAWWRGMKDIAISTSDGTNTTVRGTFTFARGDDLAVKYGEQFTLGTAWQDVKSVTLTVNSVWEPGQFHVGLGEIQFSGSPVPEPASAALFGLIGGLCVLSARRLRRTSITDLGR